VDKNGRNTLVLSIAKYLVAIFNDELNNVVPDLHVCHLTPDISVAHNGWCEDYSQVFGGHLYRIS
jgi:hypothetical protein